MSPGSSIFRTIDDPSPPPITCRIPVNTIHWDIVDSILGQRRRRWTNIEPTMAQSNVFAGIRLQDLGEDSFAPVLIERFALYGRHSLRPQIKISNLQIDVKHLF